LRALCLALIVGSLAVAADDQAPLKEKPITAEDRGHWSFRPPTRPELPQTKNTTWTRNPIDAFVLRSLEDAELKPSPEATRRVLIRRLTFDLTGLPPTPEEVEAFVKDENPDAYERVVDRLLASPHYGERWAQHWLDLARYADTDGFEFDQARPNAWRYRDWVVEAINSDLPYDQFVRLQLAGDESAGDDPSAFVATGFNRCYPDMVDLNDQKLRRQNALNDITETTSMVFLGLTLGCARCHDHKFDPIRQSDFYRLQAFFSPARFRDDYPILRPEERGEYERRRQVWELKLSRLQARLIAIESPARATLDPPTIAGTTDDVILALQRPPADRTPREIMLIFDAQARDRRIGGAKWADLLGRTLNDERRDVLARIETVRRETPPAPPQASGADEAGGAVAPTYFLRRGELSSKGPVVEPGVPAVLVAVGQTDLKIVPKQNSSGRRSALADWMVDPKNPLTARVMVNRLWQGHFGHGLVATPSDFGLQGAEPSHPELLDWLATEFPRRGWSVKALHRLIVTSASYRQDSRADAAATAIDPENNLLSHQNRKRLDGEAIRDAILATSGTLNPALGGPCVFPELPAELTKLSSKGAIWPVSPRAEDRNRRSLYVFTRRNLRFPFFEVFDRPDTSASCPRRPASTIAPQALTLLNSKLARDSAIALAARIRREGKTSREHIDRAYLLTLSRPPDATERKLADEFLAANDPGSLDDLCLALMNVNEFVYLD
jgi:hypothetical protein